MKSTISVQLMFIALTLLIVTGTLFIPQKVSNYTKPEVRLGYPINYVLVDLANNFPGLPNDRQKNLKFNILSSWENGLQVFWDKFLLSFGTIFLIFEFFLLLWGNKKVV